MGQRKTNTNTIMLRARLQAYKYERSNLWDSLKSE
jgi:hypothetical protein